MTTTTKTTTMTTTTSMLEAEGGFYILTGIYEYLIATEVVLLTESTI